jgi:lipopolysaccharide transport system ATP-binding protein
MRKKEIDRKFDEIVEFSGVERYVDTPVKRYSSGMYVRLAFAVAAHLEPEILIVDEVLAVGDAEFQKKCLGKMQDVAGHGRTILFVSHNMAAVSALCNKGLTMQNGMVIGSGSVNSCVEIYFGLLKTTGLIWNRPVVDTDVSPVVFSSIISKVIGEQPDLKLQLDLTIESREKHQAAFLAVDILDDLGVAIMQAIPTLERMIVNHGEKQQFRLEVQLPPLVPGHYSLSFWMGPHNAETYDVAVSVVGFDVQDTPTKGRSFPHTRDHGHIVPHSKLEVRS